MGDEEKKPGLGEVIYSVDENEDRKRQAREQEEVTEADKESFPASDPPGFSGSTTDPEQD